MPVASSEDAHAGSQYSYSIDHPPVWSCPMVMCPLAGQPMESHASSKSLVAQTTALAAGSFARNLPIWGRSFRRHWERFSGHPLSLICAQTYLNSHRSLEWSSHFVVSNGTVTHSWSQENAHDYPGNDPSTRSVNQYQEARGSEPSHHNLLSTHEPHPDRWWWVNLSTHLKMLAACSLRAMMHSTEQKRWI